MRNVSLKPVVSEPILDKKTNSDLIIFDISDTVSPVSGGKKIMLFCEKVNKSDISLRFFEKDPDDAIVWECIVDQKNVHRQTAIAFNTPKYRNQDIDKPVQTFLQLYRPQDMATSEAIMFEYIPLESSECFCFCCCSEMRIIFISLFFFFFNKGLNLKRKRKKVQDAGTMKLYQMLGNQAQCKYSIEIVKPNSMYFHANH